MGCGKPPTSTQWWSCCSCMWPVFAVLLRKAACCLKSKSCFLITQRVHEVCGPGRRSNLFQKMLHVASCKLCPVLFASCLYLYLCKKFLTFPWKYANVTRPPSTFFLHNHQTRLTLQMYIILLGKTNQNGIASLKE